MLSPFEFIRFSISPFMRCCPSEKSRVKLRLLLRECTFRHTMNLVLCFAQTAVEPSSSASYLQSMLDRAEAPSPAPAARQLTVGETVPCLHFHCNNFNDGHTLFVSFSQILQFRESNINLSFVCNIIRPCGSPGRPSEQADGQENGTKPAALGAMLLLLHSSHPTHFF